MSDLNVSLGLSRLDSFELEKIAAGATRLVESEEVKLLFEHIETNLFLAFKEISSNEEADKLWRQVKSVKALKEQLEHFANAREYYREKNQRKD